MISFQLVFFTTLAVNVYGQYIRHSPVSFKYLENDILNLNIVLENVPSDITQYLLHVRTDQHGLNISHITPKNGTHNVVTKLNVITELNVKNVVFDLEIKNNGQTCAILNILNGTQSTGVDGRSEFREQCLNPFGKNYCSIKVDFKNRCEDDSRLECVMKDETLTCFSGDIGQSEVAWSQHYIESSVGLPSTKVKGNSYMKMKMYKFDNNTQLSMKTEFSKKYYNVSVPLDKAEDYELETLYIDENQTSYSFTCKGAESRICILYDKKIGIYNRKSLNLTKPNELVNYLICCVQYKISNNIDGVIVERIVDQFTQIRIKPTQIQKTSYLGLYVAIPTVLLAAAFVAVVYVCCKKKPLPNPTVPTSQPYYGNQIFPREPNRGIYILPENNDPEYEQVS